MGEKHSLDSGMELIVNFTIRCILAFLTDRTEVDPLSGSSPRFVLFHDYITAAAIGHMKQLLYVTQVTHTARCVFSVGGVCRAEPRSVEFSPHRGSGSSALLAMLSVHLCACVLHRSVGA